VSKVHAFPSIPTKISGSGVDSFVPDGAPGNAGSESSQHKRTAPGNEYLPLNSLIDQAALPQPSALEQAKLEPCADLPLFTRYFGNPILSRQNWPYPINSVFNAGAVRLPDGDTLLLCRVEDRSGLSHLCAARSQNGIDGWRVDAQPP